MRAVSSAVSSVCVVGSASRVSNRPDRAVSAEVRAFVSAVRAAPVVGSASSVSRRPDRAVSAEVRAVVSDAMLFAFVVT